MRSSHRSPGNDAHPLEAMVFDVDGVLVDSPHETAWRDALGSLMQHEWRGIRPLTRWSPGAFSRSVYARLVSGRARLDGARAVLTFFGVPDDEEESRVTQFAEAKQARLEHLIATRQFRPYADALRLVLDARAAGLVLATASSSKNAPSLLAATRIDEWAGSAALRAHAVQPGLTLADLFDVDVSGRDFPRGKPDPAMFVAAVSELGTSPEATVVVEDAVAGIRAATAGRMRSVGVARANDHNLLAGSGADLVVTTLDDLDRSALVQGRIITVHDPRARGVR